MPEEYLHLTPDQVETLLQQLHQFHVEYGALDTLLDERREQLLLDGFRRFLETFLERPEQGQAIVKRLARDYFDEDIPFVLLMGAFNRIKSELIRLVASNMQQPVEHYLEIDRLFEQAKRGTAHQYLVLEARRPQRLPQSLVREKPLIRIYLDWLQQLREAVAGDLSGFPLESLAESRFTQALRYPESMMICLDLKLCDQINEQHRVILQQASILHAMLSGGRYEQGYVAYQDLLAKVSELLNLLSILYFESETNRIGRFFGFLQAALYLPGRKFLCVLNLSHLSRINKLYGAEAGGRALAHVEAVLREEFEDSQSWMLFTRGIAGDFYIVGYDVDAAELDALCARVEQCLRGAGDDLPFAIEVAYHGIELTELNELTTEDLHLVVEYLTEQAAQGRREIAVDSEDARRLLAWLGARYRRSIDLRTRLVPEHTDIFIQPLVTLDDTRGLHAFEVLGRFREGEGHISVGMFIDDIIAAGMAIDFDRLILSHIVAQAGPLRDITRRLFINVCACSLESRVYLDALVEAVKGPLRGFEVVIELTEQTLLERRELITELHREHGLHFAVDDFGTGYSTLQLVIELALEGSIRYLKLDGSLTRNVNTRSAVERIMHITRQMAHELGLETVVEVIESAAQLDKLTELKMDLGQGFLLGVPDTVAVWRGKVNYLQTRTEVQRTQAFVL